MLGAPVIMDVLREGIWATVLATLPILSVALIVGLGVGLFQALTSVQEMTLTFVPKLAVIAVTFWISMGWMTEMFVALWRDRLIPLIGGG